MNPYIVYSIFIFLLGLLIGSFLSVCIYRIPLGKTIVSGRSHCPKCDSLIPWYLNIPLISFIFLRGRCANCKEPISIRYPALELLTGLIFLLVYNVYGLSYEALFVIIFFVILIIISFIDFDHQIIPDGLVLATLILGIIHGVYHCFFLNENCLNYILGFFAASGLLFALGMLINDSIGGGDIKLMAAAGLFAGAKLILFSLFISALYALIASIPMLASKKGSIKTTIPFGPFLALGIATAVLFGEIIINWYISFFI